jgi:hypothetical protein
MAENDSTPPQQAPEEHVEARPEEPTPTEASAAESMAPPPAPPRRKRRGVGQVFTLLAAAVGLGATAIGGAAIVLKDKDERLRVIADAIEGAAKDPKGFFEHEKADLGAWLGKNLPKEADAPRAAPDQVAVEEHPESKTPATAASPGWAAPREVAQPEAKLEAPAPKPEPPVQLVEEEVERPLPPRKFDPTVPQPEPQPTKAEPPPPPAKIEQPAKIEPPAKPEPAPAAAPVAEDTAAAPGVAKRLSAIEGDVRQALEAANEARRLANAKSPEGGAKGPATLELKNSILALEGRIDELTESVAKLRAQLDQPKVETRVAPEADVNARAAQTKSLGAVETFVLAQSLHNALERGRPFAGELAALQERGADAQIVAALKPFAEHGAPRGRDLATTFLPIGKRLRAAENTAPAGSSIGDQLLHNAERLVRVRPVTQGAQPTAEDLVPRIEQALAHDNWNEANEDFAKLPESARAQAKEFGDTLARRRAAEQAATALLSTATAGLGKN